MTTQTKKRNSYDNRHIEALLENQGINGVSMHVVEMHLRNCPRESTTYRLADGTYITVHRDAGTRTNIADRSQDPYGERMVGRYKWMFLEDQSEQYDREISKLIAAKNGGDLPERAYRLALEELRSRHEVHNKPVNGTISPKRPRLPKNGSNGNSDSE